MLSTPPTAKTFSIFGKSPVSGCALSFLTTGMTVSAFVYTQQKRKSNHRGYDNDQRDGNHDSTFYGYT